jgi:RNA polymerase sigma-70 factor, ECF subfamily
LDAHAADSDLVVRAQRGEQWAFHALVNRHSDALYRLACILVGNDADAEDVLQETFLGAVGQIKDFQGRSAVKTWLTRILINQAHNLRRSRKVRRATSVEDAPSGDRSLTASSPAEPSAYRMDVEKMLGTLAPEFRAVLILRDLQGFTYEEIAESLNIPRGTVESRIHRARSAIRERFQEYGGTEAKPASREAKPPYTIREKRS